MSSYIVTGPAAVVIVAGKRRYLDRDDVVPDGADETRIKHLLAVGLIAAQPEPEPDTEDPATGDPAGENPGAGTAADGDGQDQPVLTDLDLNGLRALAADRGVDLSGITKKADIIAALEAAQ